MCKKASKLRSGANETISALLVWWNYQSLTKEDSVLLNLTLNIIRNKIDYVREIRELFIMTTNHRLRNFLIKTIQSSFTSKMSKGSR